MLVRFLFVFDLLFNSFRIALCPSVGKELSFWFFASAVFILVPVLIVGVPFPFGVQGRIWNSIVRFLIIVLFLLCQQEIQSPIHFI